MSAMNAFPDGTRVYYHTTNGTVCYGTVTGTEVLGDGTQYVSIQPEGGGANVRLPITNIGRA